MTDSTVQDRDTKARAEVLLSGVPLWGWRTVALSLLAPVVLAVCVVAFAAVSAVVPQQWLIGIAILVPLWLVASWCRSGASGLRLRFRRDSSFSSADSAIRFVIAATFIAGFWLGSPKHLTTGAMAAAALVWASASAWRHRRVDRRALALAALSIVAALLIAGRWAVDLAP